MNQSYMGNVTGRLTQKFNLFFIAAIILTFACSGKNPASQSDAEDADSQEMLRFVSTPPRAVGHNQMYRYQIEVENTDGNDDHFVIEIPTRPDWLQFDSERRLLSGLPGVEGFGQHTIKIQISNETEQAVQQFTLTIVRGALVYDGSWNPPFGQNLGHDGLTYESENLKIYSDFSTMQAKQQLADLLEAAFQELQENLSVDKSDFDYLPGWTKIDIYADHNQTNQIGLAYRDGSISLQWFENNYFDLVKEYLDNQG